MSGHAPRIRAVRALVRRLHRATQDRVGLFDPAAKGTILIDEIRDLDVALQAKLLRVIDAARYRQLGSNDYRRADVRLIAATRRDLDREISEGRFRDDPYHRLAVAAATSRWSCATSRSATSTSIAVNTTIGRSV